jgi:chemotaxis protein MotA
MDFASLGGTVLGMAMVLYAITLNSGLDLFYDFPAVLIVFGGTAAATLIAYPMNEVLRVLGLFLKVFMAEKSDPHDLIDSMVMVNNIARKGGILAIESKLPEIKHPFLVKGLSFTVDGKDEATVISLLKREISQRQKSHKDGWEIFSEMGKFAPGFGMVGTLIGLVQMLADLQTPDTLGPKMAVALLTTFYGALLANLVFLPMSVKLKRRSASESLEMNLVLEGIVYIRKGVNPRFMKEVLENLLGEAEKKARKAEGAKTKPARKAEKTEA